VRTLHKGGLRHLGSVLRLIKSLLLFIYFMLQMCSGANNKRTLQMRKRGDAVVVQGSGVI
jgi:hypothetical protein